MSTWLLDQSKNTFEEQRKNCPSNTSDKTVRDLMGWVLLKPHAGVGRFWDLWQEPAKGALRHDRHPSLYLQSGGSRMVVGVLFFPFLNLD